MLDSPGRISAVSNLSNTWRAASFVANDRTVDVTIRRIRKHFESDSNTSELISTIHGEGYRFIGKIDS